MDDELDPQWHTFRYVMGLALPFIVLFGVTFGCCFVTGLLTGDRAAFAGFTSLGILTGIVVAALAVAVTIFSSRFSPPPNHHVLLRERNGLLRDLGPGNKYLGVIRWMYPLKTYSPRPRTLSLKDLRLPLKDGSNAIVTVHVTWRPDPENLPTYFDDEGGYRLEHLVRAQFEGWSRELKIEDIFATNTKALEGPQGFLLEDAILLSPRPEFGHMMNHLVDEDSIKHWVTKGYTEEAAVEAAFDDLVRKYPEKKEQLEVEKEARVMKLRDKRR